VTSVPRRADLQACTGPDTGEGAIVVSLGACANPLSGLAVRLSA
jgi:hypothetical protein